MLSWPSLNLNYAIRTSPAWAPEEDMPLEAERSPTTKGTLSLPSLHSAHLPASLVHVSKPSQDQQNLWANLFAQINAPCVGHPDRVVVCYAAWMRPWQADMADFLWSKLSSASSASRKEKCPPLAGTRGFRKSF